MFLFAHANPTGLNERPEPPLFNSNTCGKYVLLHACAHASEPTSARLLKWSYLSQHSSPMTGGMEGSRGGDPGGPQADELMRPALR